MRPAWLVAMLACGAGCGRLGFDAVGAPGDAHSGDASPGDGPHGPVDSSDGGFVTNVITWRDVGTVSGNSATQMMTAMVVPGDTLVVITNRTGLDTNTVTWGGQPLSEDVAIPSYGTAPLYTSVWSLYVTTAGNQEVQATASGTAQGDLFVGIAHGLASTGALDRSAMATGSGVAATAGPTATTSAANELVIAVVGGEGNATTGALWNTPLVVDTSTGNAIVNLATDIAHAIVTSKGAYGATRGDFSSRPWGAAIATYRAP